MKNELFRVILKVHKKLPFIPFEKELVRIYHLFQEKEKIVNVKINGIYYRLDLSELIDNKVFYGNWEPDTTSMFNRIVKPEMTVLDIGANMGYYTLLIGKLMKNHGRIISFEPTSEGFERLKTNVSLNNFRNIVLEKLALANENKKTKISIRSSWKMSGLAKPKTETIKMMKLDDYVKKNKIGKIDFIKIDVDGYEYEILKGAKKVLKTHKPILCLEIGHYKNENPGYNIEEIVEFMKSFGYSFYHENGKKIDQIKDIMNRIPNSGCKNFLLM